MIATGTCAACKRPVWVRKRAKWEVKTLQGTKEAICPECDEKGLTEWEKVSGVISGRLVLRKW